MTYEWGDYIKRTKAGELTAGTYGWSGDNGDPDNFLSPLFGSSNIGNSNYARFNSPELDALLDKAIGLSDKGERTKLYGQAQVLLNEQAPWIKRGSLKLTLLQLANVCKITNKAHLVTLTYMEPNWWINLKIGHIHQSEYALIRL